MLNEPYSSVLVSGDLAFVSGQAALDPVTHAVVGIGIAEQTRITVDRLKHLLASVGASLDDVVKVNAYLADIGDFEVFSEVYTSLFASPRPARTTVGVQLSGILVEIDCIARISSGGRKQQ